MTYYDIKNEWLAPATLGMMQAFYMVQIKPLDSRYDKYKLASLEDAVALENTIVSIAVNEMGLSPPQLFFPEGTIKYQKIIGILNNIASNWLLQVQVEDTMEQNTRLITSDPALVRMYDDRMHMIMATFRMLSRDMLDIRLITKYMEDERANN